MQLLNDHFRELFEMCGDLLKMTSEFLALHPGLAHVIHGKILYIVFWHGHLVFIILSENTAYILGHL